GAARLALVELARGGGAERALVAGALDGLALHDLAREADAVEVDHRALHRDLDALPAPGGVALVERRQYADHSMQTGPGIAHVRPRPQRRPARLARNRERTADRLRDHVEAQE